MAHKQTNNAVCLWTNHNNAKVCIWTIRRHLLFPVTYRFN